MFSARSISHSLSAQLNCSFSNDWLYEFKTRRNFWCFKSHGEINDADSAGTAAALPHQRELALHYPLSVISNADEFGLAYSAAPTRSIAPGILKGRKHSNQLATFLICANVDETEYLSPLMIGRAQRPRCFGGKTPNEMGLDYEYNKKA